MSSQRALCQWKLPIKIVKEKPTKRDILYSDIHVIEKHHLKWTSAEVDSVGTHLASSLTDCLWYIDGKTRVYNSCYFS